MDNTNTLTPSHETRLRYLKMASGKNSLASKIFLLAGIVFILFGIILIVIFWGQSTVMYGTETVNGIAKETATTVPLSAFSICGFLPGIFLLIGSRMYGAVQNKIKKGYIDYNVANTDYNKNTLLDIARSDKELSEIGDVSVNGDWIDVSMCWYNAVALSNAPRLHTNVHADLIASSWSASGKVGAPKNVEKEKRIYRKMFFVQDDHTVRELDGNESLAVYVGLGIGGAVLKEYGHFFC